MHGFKVGIGTLATLALYEDLLRRDLGRLDVEQALASWASPRKVERRIVEVFGAGELADKAREETQAQDAESRRVASPAHTVTRRLA